MPGEVNLMQRLMRLDVSVDLAVYLLMLWMLYFGAIPLIFSGGFAMNNATGEFLLSLLEVTVGRFRWGLVLLLLGFAWLETRVQLRPWVKRLLRLSGALFPTLVLAQICLYRSWVP